MGNAQTVQSIYEWFGQGDIPSIVGTLADDVAWEQWDDHHAQKAGVPWFQGGVGKDAALAFFGVAGGLEVKDVQVLDIIDGGDVVVAEFEIEFVVPDTGRSLRDQELHRWTFDADGKVTSLRHYSDTAKHIAAAGLQLP